MRSLLVQRPCSAVARHRAGCGCVALLSRDQRRVADLDVSLELVGEQQSACDQRPAEAIQAVVRQEPPVSPSPFSEIGDRRLVVSFQAGHQRQVGESTPLPRCEVLCLEADQLRAASIELVAQLRHKRRRRDVCGVQLVGEGVSAVIQVGKRAGGHLGRFPVATLFVQGVGLAERKLSSARPFVRNIDRVLKPFRGLRNARAQLGLPELPEEL